jgi:hypothetical protein
MPGGAGAYIMPPPAYGLPAPMPPGLGTAGIRKLPGGGPYGRCM